MYYFHQQRLFQHQDLLHQFQQHIQQPALGCSPDQQRPQPPPQAQSQALIQHQQIIQQQALSNQMPRFYSSPSTTTSNTTQRVDTPPSSSSSSSASTSPLLLSTTPLSPQLLTSHSTSGARRSSRSKSKRVRTIFTPEQLKRLEQEFSNQMYLVGHDRGLLASSLNLTEAQVKVWFQNRRIKFRKLAPGPALDHSPLLYNNNNNIQMDHEQHQELSSSSPDNNSNISRQSGNTSLGRPTHSLSSSDIFDAIDANLGASS